MPGIWSSGAKAIFGAIGKAVDTAADVGFRAGTRTVKMAGGVARAATATERYAPKAVRAAAKVADGIESIATSGATSVSRRALLHGAATAGFIYGVGSQAKGTLQDMGRMSGLSGDFLAQHSLRRTYGQRDSTPKNRDDTLGDLTLNLGNTSVLNKSIKGR